jgi:hypothetical protein
MSVTNNFLGSIRLKEGDKFNYHSLRLLMGAIRAAQTIAVGPGLMLRTGESGSIISMLPIHSQKGSVKLPWEVKYESNDNGDKVVRLYRNGGTWETVWGKEREITNEKEGVTEYAMEFDKSKTYAISLLYTYSMIKAEDDDPDPMTLECKAVTSAEDFQTKVDEIKNTDDVGKSRAVLAMVKTDENANPTWKRLIFSSQRETWAYEFGEADNGNDDGVSVYQETVPVNTKPNMDFEGL